MRQQIRTVVGMIALLTATGGAMAQGRRPGADDPLPPSASMATATKPAETIRLPYSKGRVYQVRLLPGAPFALELPSGESARNIWFDNRWWAAESTPGSSRVFLRASAATDVVGRAGFVHIETEPSDLRVSLRVEAVSDRSDVPAALELYLEGSALQDPMKAQARRLADRDLVYANKQAQEKARAEFEAWRRNAVVNMRTDYEWGGDFRVTRVVDDKVQTFITIPDASDRAVIQYVDKAGKAELVNYELENGTYMVQNKVLRPGEKFRLILGKQQAWVALR